MKLKGKGIVNDDSTDQKRYHFMYDTGLPADGNDNVNYAKKNFYGTGIKGNFGKERVNYRIKISSDCLKTGIFGEDIISTSPNIMHHPQILYNYIASPVAILRGWMFAMENNTIKKKSSLTLLDVEQCCNSKSFIETFAKSEYKGAVIPGEKSANNFFKAETIGDIEYSNGNNYNTIDLSSLQIISLDTILDRYSFNPDYFNVFKDFFQDHFGNSNITLGYHKLKTSVVDLNEHSILLGDENVKIILKQLFNKILKLNITRRDAYASIESLEVRLVEDPLVQTVSNPDGWLKIESESDVDSLLGTFNIHQFYEPVDENIEKVKRAETDAKVKAAKTKATKAK